MNLFNSKFILSNKRFGWIDYDRGISIILVTYRHCYETLFKSGVDLNSYPVFEYINVFFFGFRMPLFFIASGIFVSGSLAKRGLGAYSKNRVQSILWPLMVWGFIQISLQIIFGAYGLTNSDTHADSYLYLLIDPRRTGQFWYLNALFFVGIIYSFLKMVFKVKLWQQFVIGIGLYSFAAYIHSTTIDIGFAIDICQYYVFFAVGDAISGFMLKEKTAQVFTSWKTIIPLLTAFIVIQYFFTKINLEKGDNYFVEHHMPVFFILVALVGCAISIAFSFTLKKQQSLLFLRVVGYNSVHIYCMQIIAMSVTRLILMKVLHFTYVPGLVLITLTGGVLLPMIFYNIALRLNMWWLFSLKKPEDEIQFLAEQKLKTT
ncbi:MAG: acyltransferase [Ferruginibacter sp.]